MNDRLSRLESEVRNLSRALDSIEERLDSLEKNVGPQARIAAPPLATPSSGPTDSEIASLISFAGRTLLVLGGGYLLRALTESGTLPPLA